MRELNKGINNLPFKIIIIVFATAIIAFRLYVSKDNPYSSYYYKNIDIYGYIAEDYGIKNSIHSYKVNDIILEYNNKIERISKSIEINMINKKYGDYHNKNNANCLNIGDFIQLRSIQLKPIKNYDNNNFILSNKYLISKNIYGIASIGTNQVNLIKKHPYNLFNICYNLRKRMEAVFNNMPLRERQLTTGVVFGENDLPVEEKAKFQDMGISHVLAVSGFNLGIIIYFTGIIFRKINGNSKIKALFIIAASWLFCIIAGLQDSIVRATIMATVLQILAIAEIEYSTLFSLFIASFLILFFNPNAIYSIGFLFSTGAVAGISLFYERLYKFIRIPWNYLRESIALSIAAQILLIPLIINTFNKISYGALVLNIIVVPITGILTITGLLSSIAGLIFINIGFFLNGINYVIARLILFIVDNSHSILSGCINLGAISFVFFILYYIIVAIVFSDLKSKKKLFIICSSLALSFIIFHFNFEDSGNLRVNIIDVGQGDSIFIQSPHNKNILIDSGGLPSFTKSNFDTGKMIVTPFLRNKFVNTIDLLISTHSHDDHIGGFCNVIDNFNIKEAALSKYTGMSEKYEEFLRALKKHKIKTIYPLSGDSFNIDGITFDVLNPQRKNIYINTHSDSNNDSIVLMLKYKKFSMLLLGDAEHEAEEVIMDNCNKEGYSLRCKILKVAHHGSRFSSTMPFLRSAMPEVSVISVGAHNMYGHPASATLLRLRKIKSKIYRTDRNGCITITSNGLSYNTEAAN